jgi:hypothetical protein
MFNAAINGSPPSTVAPTSAGNATWVWSVRSTPAGANRYGVWKKPVVEVSAVRIHQKSQRNTALSPKAPPGRSVARCRDSGRLQAIAIARKPAATARWRVIGGYS